MTGNPPTLRTVKALAIIDGSDPIMLISKVSYAPLTRQSYVARMGDGELVERDSLSKLLTALARRVKKGETP